MLQLEELHHVAVICTDYQRSKQFYTDVLGMKVLREVYREDRQSYKLDLALKGGYVLELFSFPEPPARVSQPEAAGLRHLAFAVADIAAAREELLRLHVPVEPIRQDPYTGKRFTFFSDPDDLPLELYES
ncbi:SMU1112c/YaeR family gloxylase I-like metalloprotein [Pontibacter oryzae]|uniref:VOC family protein n=1 Tax=Pontibacter oryzae TaxID=2304593 RepID=A0A399SHT5_9BACT|nr:VOC family protein [Pontibacter oryzae]RIJ42419.1 VOC family protein [Pontibacter oryzae]